MEANDCNKTSTPTMAKSKIVTLFRTDHGGCGSTIPMTKCKGKSRSERRSMEITFPSYSDNTVFYEHFKDIDSESPNRLTFLYLRGSSSGEINYNFRQYENVLTVDISDEDFGTVSSIFQILCQLPKCRELRIFLSEKNILPSTDDEELRKKLSSSGSGSMPPLQLVNSIETLIIKQIGNIPLQFWSDNDKSRMDYILQYAAITCPQLKRLIVTGLDGSAGAYKAVNHFVKSKPDLPPHNVTVKDDKLNCQPTLVGFAQRQHSYVSNWVNGINITPETVKPKREFESLETESISDDSSSTFSSAAVPFKDANECIGSSNNGKEFTSQMGDHETGRGECKILKHLTVKDLNNILNVAKGGEPTGSLDDKRKGSTYGRKRTMKDLEGVLFDRRSSKPKDPPLCPRILILSIVDDRAIFISIATFY